jgi:hypothetical protein
VTIALFKFIFTVPPFFPRQNAEKIASRSALVAQARCLCGFENCSPATNSKDERKLRFRIGSLGIPQRIRAVIAIVIESLA